MKGFICTALYGLAWWLIVGTVKAAVIAGVVMFGLICAITWAGLAKDESTADLEIAVFAWLAAMVAPFVYAFAVVVNG